MAEPKTYTAPHAVYTGGMLYNPGRPFTTSEKKGEQWQLVSPKDKAAIEASDRTQREDPPLEGLSKSALEAIAVERNVDPTGLSKADLIVAIRAANEPRL